MNATKARNDTFDNNQTLKQSIKQSIRDQL